MFQLPSTYFQHANVATSLLVRALRPARMPVFVTLAMSCAGEGLPWPPPYGHVVLKSRGGRSNRFCMLNGSRTVLKPSSLILRTMVTKSAPSQTNSLHVCQCFGVFQAVATGSPRHMTTVHELRECEAGLRRSPSVAELGP